MIKKTMTYKIEGQDAAFAPRAIAGRNAAETFEAAKEAIVQQLALNGIDAVVAEDIFSYKTGMFKSEQAPCLIVSQATAPNDYRKLVVSVTEAHGCAILTPAWYGESKADVLYNKGKKIEKKRDKTDQKFEKNRDSEYGTMSTATRLAGTSLIQTLRINSINKKLRAVSDDVNFYQNRVLQTVSAACDSIAAGA